MRRAFAVDLERSRTIRLTDLIIVAIATFVAFPALLIAIGYVGLHLVSGTDVMAGQALALIYSFGLTGLFAWTAAPIAIGVGWYATRRGWIGPLSIPLFGAAGGLIFSLILALGEDITDPDPALLPLTLLFVAYAMTYAAVGWLVLRWRRADVFRA